MKCNVSGCETRGILLGYFAGIPLCYCIMDHIEIGEKFIDGIGKCKQYFRNKGK